MNPPIVDHPARLAAQELGDLVIAVAAIAAGQSNDICGALGGAMMLAGWTHELTGIRIESKRTSRTKP